MIWVVVSFSHSCVTLGHPKVAISQRQISPRPVWLSSSPDAASSVSQWQPRVAREHGCFRLSPLRRHRHLSSPPYLLCSWLAWPCSLSGLRQAAAPSLLRPIANPEHYTMEVCPSVPVSTVFSLATHTALGSTPLPTSRLPSTSTPTRCSLPGPQTVTASSSTMRPSASPATVI
jgi:hypothetical protein